MKEKIAFAFTFGQCKLTFCWTRTLGQGVTVEALLYLSKLGHYLLLIQTQKPTLKKPDNCFSRKNTVKPGDNIFNFPLGKGNLCNNLNINFLPIINACDVCT